MHSFVSRFLVTTSISVHFLLLHQSGAERATSWTPTDSTDGKLSPESAAPEDASAEAPPPADTKEPFREAESKDVIHHLTFEEERAREADDPFAKIKGDFDPEKGPIKAWLDQMRVSAKDTKRAAHDWHTKSHEAILAANHMLTRATNQAQTVFFKDGLRMNEAVKGNMLDETAKMDALGLDHTAKDRIIKEHEQESARVLLPPTAGTDPIVGKNIICNEHYQGRNAPSVWGARGKVISYSPVTQRYLVRLKGDSRWMPKLSQNDFSVVQDEEEIDGVEMEKAEAKEEETPVEEPEEDAHAAEWKSKMDTYGEKRVRIDHIPEHLAQQLKSNEDKIRDILHIQNPADLVLHKTGTIQDWRHNDGDYEEFAIKLDNEDELKALGDVTLKPWLVRERDFHLATDLEGKRVVVDKPHSNTRLQSEGIVKDWQSNADGPGGGYYNVEIPAHIERVKSNELERDRSHWSEDAIKDQVQEEQASPATEKAE